MSRIRNADYERITDNITAKQSNFMLYLIAAEGDKTEAEYFQAIENLFKERNIAGIHVEFIDRPEVDAGKSAPQYVHKTLESIEKQLQDKGYQITSRDELWFIIDVDEYDNRVNSLNDLKKVCDEKTYFYMALSNPCFEIWLILHFREENIFNNLFQDYTFKKRPKKCKQVLSDVGHKNYIELFNLTSIASDRAKKLKPCSLDKEYLNQFACTDVYKLLDKLYALFNP